MTNPNQINNEYILWSTHTDNFVRVVETMGLNYFYVDNTNSLVPISRDLFVYWDTETRNRLRGDKVLTY
jgi:hypothetical protein